MLSAAWHSHVTMGGGLDSTTVLAMVSSSKLACDHSAITKLETPLLRNDSAIYSSNCMCNNINAESSQTCCTMPLTAGFVCVAADCLPGLVCDFTAKLKFAVCVQPEALGATCGARLNGTNTISKTPVQQCWLWNLELAASSCNRSNTCLYICASVTSGVGFVKPKFNPPHALYHWLKHI